MNDLNGLEWSSKPTTNQNKGTGNYNSSAFSTLKPTPPASGRASPFQTSTSPAPPSKSTTPANDSFSNLVAFSSTTANKNGTLQEQQKRLQELKLSQLASQKQSIQNAWAGNDDAWNNLGSGRSTPAQPTGPASSLTKSPPVQHDDDLFAAFNNAPSVPPATVTKPVTSNTFDDDDDPFGLSELAARPTKSTSSRATTFDDEDDILGDLAKPVSARPPPRREPSPVHDAVPPSNHPQDRAVAELVDMGFPADKARGALERTESGIDVQAAVGLLLNQAHEEARQKTRPRESTRNEMEDLRPSSRQPRSTPANREDLSQRNRSSTPSGDAARQAQDLGASFLKSAGSFWKQAQKQVAKAVEDFNSDSDSSQPKWMREPAAPRSQPQHPQPDERRRRRSSAGKQKAADFTDEAMMLDSQRPTPAPRPAPRQRPDPVIESSSHSSRDHSPAMPSRLRESSSPQPAFMRQQQIPIRQPQPSPRSMLSKQAAEDQASQAYVSSARRRKPAATPVLGEADLLEGSAPVTAPRQPPASRPAPPTKPKPAPSPAPITVRPAAPPRTIPSISALSLKASHTARLQGNTSFKRGDYTHAHESYTTALRHLPASHPLTLPLLTNLALTSLKTGSPNLTITHANTALALIGPSKGESEVVTFPSSPSNEPPKPMREYYGKSLMRKAEALEQMEKWIDALSVWRTCVEDGHGGAPAIQARARAEKAAAPKSAPKPTPKPKPAPPRLAARPAQDSAAVTALRAANAAAERADDEKFALTDSVDARIAMWRGGKESNLRALLGSLDTVLWEGSGWKKVSMAELVLPNKVKIVYMRGIAKVHPDKIPTNATTEQRMIAGAVFGTLNEAWDKFKTENGL